MSGRWVLDAPDARARPLDLLRWRWRESQASMLVLAGVGAYAAIAFYAMNRSGYDVWGGLFVLPILLALSMPLLSVMARHEDDPRLATVLFWALIAKLVMAIPRWGMGFILYGGVADASGYSGAGAMLANAYRHLHFIGPPSTVTGTNTLQVITGIIYVFTGNTTLGGYIVFSWIGFWGLYLYYRAVKLAVPEVDHFRYALFVFFLPTMLFWPSSIGKDAWMCMGIGLSTYGAARLFRSRRGAYPILAAGLVATAIVRPNMTAILFAALFIGYLLRPAGPRATVLSPIFKTLGIVLLLVAGFVVINKAKSFFGLTTLSVTSVQHVIHTAGVNTTIGGSSFTPTPVHNPLEFPVGAVTVLFRPFPWESHNIQVLLTGMEGVFLMGATALSWRRFAAVRHHLRNPFVIMALVYSVEFIYAFSRFGNYGIIARERAQLYPFFLLFLCLRPWRHEQPAALPLRKASTPV
ncbi:MAG: hypothetical protein ACYCYA_02890 [Actinomycetes bacterium]